MKPELLTDLCEICPSFKASIAPLSPREMWFPFGTVKIKKKKKIPKKTKKMCSLRQKLTLLWLKNKLFLPFLKVINGLHQTAISKRIKLGGPGWSLLRANSM